MMSRISEPSERFRMAGFVSTAMQLVVSILALYLDAVWVQHARDDEGSMALFHSVFGWMLLVVAALIVLVAGLGIVGVWRRVWWLIIFTLLCWSASI